MRPTHQAVTESLGVLFMHPRIETTVISWQEIMQHISHEFTITNWLTQVRSPLQGLINHGVVRRTPDVHHEGYTLC